MRQFLAALSRKKRAQSKGDSAPYEANSGHQQTHSTIDADNIFIKNKVRGLLAKSLDSDLAVDKQELQEARNYLENLHMRAPHLPGFNLTQGNIEMAAGNFEQAAVFYQQQLRATPQDGSVWFQYGDSLFRAKSYQKAKRALMRASDLLDEDFDARVKLAYVFFAEKNYDLAERGILQLQRFETSRKALELLVAIYIAQERYEEAAQQLESILDSFGKDARVYGLYAHIFHKMEKFEQSSEFYGKAAHLDPNSVEILANLGMLYRDAGDNIKARQCFEKALSINGTHNGAKCGLSLCLLSTGDYKKGWPLYEQRLHRHDYFYRKFDLPRWDGKPDEISGVLVTGEQGLGDQIMFSSCLPDLISEGIPVVIECLPKLENIFKRSFPGAIVVGRAPTQLNEWATEFEQVKYEIPIGSLPGVYRTDVNRFPARAGFLRANPKRTEYWREKLALLGDKPKVGISWQGGVKSTRRNVRSIPLHQWLPILKLPIECISLQYTNCHAEISELQKQSGCVVHHWPEAIDDYDETAALINALDLVISVQTAVVHLAGALGKPTIAMISAAPEWRYGVNVSAMPWYPSVNLVRQRKLFDWAVTLEEVSELVCVRLDGDFFRKNTP